MTEKTSADRLERHIRGRLLANSGEHPSHAVIVQIFAREQQQESFLVPAVAEPLLVWVLKGSALVEERDPGGEWSGVEVSAGDFFIADSDAPYELRWKSLGADPFEVMHLYFGLALMERAAADIGVGARRALLREVSGARDTELASYIRLIVGELAGTGQPSSLYLESTAQAMAVQLVRRYRDEERTSESRRSALPVYRLRKVTDMMDQNLSSAFDLRRYASAAGMSVAHFSRQFKQATGLAPSRYFIRLRIARARQLLRETEQSVISIGMEVGYSSPSHFAQVFRKETGASPRAYRGN